MIKHKGDPADAADAIALVRSNPPARRHFRASILTIRNQFEYTPIKPRPCGMRRRRWLNSKTPPPTSSQ